MTKPIFLRPTRGILEGKQWAVAGWLVLYMAWVFISPALLEWRGEQEAAGWVMVWLIQSLAAGVPIGLIAIFWPKWYMLSLFSLCTIVHLAFGLGCFPR